MRHASRTWIAICVTMFAATACQRNEPAPPPTTTATPAAPAAPGATAVPPSNATGGSAVSATEPAEPAALVAERVPTVELSVPRTVMIGKAGEVSFSIEEAAIEPRNSESMRLVLSVRMHNKQRRAASFADENFQLLTQNSVIGANGGLAETIDAGSESSAQRVQFLVPANAAPRALKIEFGGETAELPLSFKR